ncbi:SH3 domain-containing protein [Clostridiales bacterium FE2011]|nr:SH3 domain-containing protein [Clostridiales bacterium FE2011]
MTVYRRRLLCLALVLSMLLTLIPAATGSRNSAYAEADRKGITLDKVNMRYGAGSDQKIAFTLPANHVCTILDTKTVQNVLWYKVETIDPARKNSNKYTGYIHGDFFRELTAEEVAQYNTTGNSATPTPVPVANGDTPTPTPTPVPAAGNVDLPAIAGSIGSVTAGGTNLREGPGTGYHSITRLDRNTQVELLTIPSIRGGGANTFYKVKYGNDVGYIMSDFISILSGGPQNGTSVVVTPVPASAVSAATPAPNTTAYTHVKLTLSSCHLRVSPDGDYDPNNDWTGKGTVLLLAGNPVKKGSYTWYPVSKDGKTYYVRNDCVQPYTDKDGTAVTPTPAPATATPVPATVTATPIPNDTQYGMVQLILTSCHLRTSPDGSYDAANDWEGRGSVLMLTGDPVTKGKYSWYPVRKDGKTYYVRSDCVQPLASITATPAAVTATPAPDAVTATPAPNAATATPVPANVTYTHVRLILTSAHLRSAPDGSYDSDNDWVGLGSTLPLAGSAVKQGGYNWYPVTKGGKKYYVREDCVQPYVDGNASTPTAVPEPTATINPNGIGWVKTTKGGVNLRATIGGTTIKQLKKGVTLPYLLEPVQKNGYTWYFVQDGNNRGYLRSDVVTVVNAPATTPTPTPAADGSTPGPTAVTPTETPATGYLKTNSGGVNLRKKAGYTDTIGRVDKNVVLPYYGEPTKVKGVNWYYVKHPTLGYGYLHGTYINLCNADGSALATPTPAPTNTPAPGTTAAPANNNQTEASYNTLKTGSTGDAVKNLVTELKNQGYYTGSVTSKYTTAVADAVKAFQKAKGLTVDGIAGAATQHKLFNTVPVGYANLENLTMTLYPAEKIDWYTGGINELWATGSNYKVYDVKTGIVWWAHRWSGGSHVDAEPLTAADTARLCRCYGVSNSQQIADKNLYQRRPLLVTIGSRTFACSLYGVPHNYPEGDTISDNDFKGQLCIHFTNSKTHSSKKVDSGHEQAIQYAWEHAPNGHK